MNFNTFLHSYIPFWVEDTVQFLTVTSLIKKTFLLQVFRVESNEGFYFGVDTAMIPLTAREFAAIGKDGATQPLVEDIIMKSLIFLDKWCHLFIKNTAIWLNKPLYLRIIQVGCRTL